MDFLLSYSFLVFGYVELIIMRIEENKIEGNYNFGEVLWVENIKVL